MTSRVRRTLLGLAGVALAVACDGGPTELPGSLEVQVSSTGGDLDRDGYRLVLDARSPDSVGVAQLVELNNVRQGPHALELLGVADNCTVAGENPRAVTVESGTSVHVSFSVHCVGTGVHVMVATTGIDLDVDGYSLVLDGEPPRNVGVVAEVTITYLSAGAHTLTLANAAANCLPGQPNPQTLNLVAGQITDDPLTVTCTAVSGSVVVAAPTTGLDPDNDGYTVSLDGGAARSITVGGLLALTGLAGGSHTVALGGVASNCTVAGGTQQTFNVTTGGLTRDTALATFDVTCAARTGDLEVTAHVSGLDVGAGAYQVRLDNATLLSMPAAGGMVRQAELLPGTHAVELLGVPNNCTATPANPLMVTVQAGGQTRDTVRTSFGVVCVAVTGVIQLVAITSGSDPDSDGYVIRVDDIPSSSMNVGNNSTMDIPGVAAGTHMVRLLGVKTNCAPVEPNPAVVQIVAGSTVRDTAKVTFTVSCIQVTGSVQISATTSGNDPDADGYSVALDQNSQVQWVNVPANGSMTIAGLMPGLYVARLYDVVSNCDTTGPGTQSGGVIVGGTTTFAFAVSCRPAAQLAVSASGGRGIVVLKENGTGRLDLTSNAVYDAEPAWSPDGSEVAFVSSRDGNREIYVMNADGSGQQRLTNNPAADEHPDWSPDGTKIAFTSTRDGNAEIYVMNADGSNAVRLTNHPAVDADPAWSPDGLRIAFSSTRTGHARIYVMNADGTGAAGITPGLVDEIEPAWSPDNTRIAFARYDYNYYYSYTYEIVVIRADGSSEVALWAAGAAPAWSRDGRWIAYSQATCDYYSYVCSVADVALVAPDGSRFQNVMSSAVQPAWRP